MSMAYFSNSQERFKTADRGALPSQSGVIIGAGRSRRDKVEKSDEQASDFERAAEQSMDDGNSVKDLEQVRMGATKVSYETRLCLSTSTFVSMKYFVS